MRAVCPFIVTNISIHAPRKGSDARARRVTAATNNFNPRSPQGERRSEAALTPAAGGHFNPRSPQGERRPPARRLPREVAISIHAPRKGSDRLHEAQQVRPVGFQSTLPARGATFRNVSSIYLKRYFNPRSPQGERPRLERRHGRPAGISIHAPRRGSDNDDLVPPSIRDISIHAPRRGSD